MFRSSLLCALVVFATCSLVFAQEEEKKEDKKPTKKAEPKFPLPDPPVAASTGPEDPAAPAKKLREQIVEQQKRLEDLTATLGDEHPKVEATKIRMIQLTTQLAEIGAQAKRKATSRQVTPGQFLRRTFGDPDAGGGRRDIAAGRNLVISGLEIEIKSLVQAVKQSKDDETRQSKKEELRETVEMLVNARTVFRKREIERLEARLAELKEQQEGDSADAIMSKILGEKKDKAPSSDAKEEAGAAKDGA